MDEKDIIQKREREKKTVGVMIEIYCHGNHKMKKGILCEECENLKSYAWTRVEHCPHMATKTFCSKCETHCYRPEMRERIRMVMRYAGPRIIWYCPVMCIRHFVQTLQK